MANKILLKKSSVSNRIPAVGDLTYGELALNYADGTLYYKTVSDAIEPLVSKKQIFKVITASFSTASPQVVDSFPASQYRTAKYIVQVTQDSTFQSSELLVMHDGTSTYSTEYALMHSTANPICTVTTDISGGNVRLIVTMGTNIATSINIRRLALEV